MKDHEIAALVNELRDTAVKYRDAQQLRQRIAALIVPALRGVRSPAPAAEWREPTPEECIDIYFAWLAEGTSGDTPEHRMGRAMFDAVRKVMEGK